MVPLDVGKLAPITVQDEVCSCPWGTRAICDLASRKRTSEDTPYQKVGE